MGGGGAFGNPFSQNPFGSTPFGSTPFSDPFPGKGL
jgi:hypothetical protein